MSEHAVAENVLSTSSQDKWRRVGTQLRAGVLAPLFSVYSSQSTGCGDICDIMKLVDWCVATGNSIIQLLPMNDMAGVMCPYDAVSSFALDPVFISLEHINKHYGQKYSDAIAALRAQFPAGTPHVDWGIKQAKLNLLWDIFCNEDYCKDDCDQFCREQRYWLDDYALFRALKQTHDQKAWFDWPHQYKNRDQGALSSFWGTHQHEIAFHMWLQWNIYLQFVEAKQYAQSKGVLLKGDLPILVSRDSADVWSHPDFFKLELASGAPPDMYAAKGQRWGMPTYNWQNIAYYSYEYLKAKLWYAQNFYDIVRVDHVVGLFRIWSISHNEPLENQGLNGFFDPPDEQLWGKQGSQILQVMLGATDMLLCAEDLGVIPAVCTETLKHLGIPGNDVQRWIKDWNHTHTFLGPECFRQLSVAMLSTHDTTNWAAWWKYEAGTVDQTLFARKCGQYGIDYAHVENMLFDTHLSAHGRLRWKRGITPEAVCVAFGRAQHCMGDIMDLYFNSYGEKEKLWKQLGMPAAMQEDATEELIHRALGLTLDSKAVFVVNTLIDWLAMSGCLSGDVWEWRINTPGTVSAANWTLTMPLSLDDMINHPLTAQIRFMITQTHRVPVPS
jgi:4-alpha-glucanotransferase